MKQSGNLGWPVSEKSFVLYIPENMRFFKIYEILFDRYKIALYKNDLQKSDIKDINFEKDSVLNKEIILFEEVFIKANKRERFISVKNFNGKIDPESILLDVCNKDLKYDKKQKILKLDLIFHQEQETNFLINWPLYLFYFDTLKIMNNVDTNYPNCDSNVGTIKKKKLFSKNLKLNFEMENPDNIPDLIHIFYKEFNNIEQLKISSFEKIESFYSSHFEKIIDLPYLHKLNDFLQIKARPEDQLNLKIDFSQLVNEKRPMCSFAITPEEIGKERGEFQFLEQEDYRDSENFDKAIYSCYLAIKFAIVSLDKEIVLKISSIFFKNELDWFWLDSENLNSELIEESLLERNLEGTYRLLFYKRDK